jgi:hypothetical protein
MIDREEQRPAAERHSLNILSSVTASITAAFARLIEQLRIVSKLT